MINMNPIVALCCMRYKINGEMNLEEALEMLIAEHMFYGKFSISIEKVGNETKNARQMCSLN